MAEALIEAIFWDNDGVLVDTEELYFEASREALARVGIALSHEQFVEISLTAGQSLMSLAADRVPGGERGELGRWRNRRYEQLLRDRARPMDGIRETLDELDGRFVMGVVTSSLREHFDAAHERLGLRERFSFVLAREDYRVSKPDPEPYRTAAERNGLDPARCLVVEDSPRGLASARAAGMRCAVLAHDLTRDCSFEGAWQVLTRLAELPPLVLPLAAGRTARG